MKKFILPILLIAAILFTAVNFAPYAFNFYLIPPSPNEYGKIALKKMDTYGLYTDTASWKKAYQAALADLRACKSYKDTYPILEKALYASGGKHSFLLKAGEPLSGSTKSDVLPETKMLGAVACIKLPNFAGSPEGAAAYANIVQDFLHANQSQIKGVLLDLRENTGGDLAPMLSAVSGLLPDGALLYYHGKTQDIPVTLSQGILSNAGSGSYILYPEEKLTVPVTVLTNEMTASSAEALALIFKGQPNSASFGTETAGYTSANQSFFLFDGAQMFLTVSGERTLENELFENDSIHPDYPTAFPEEDALNWLHARIKSI